MKNSIYQLILITILFNVFNDTHSEECNTFDHEINQKYQKCRDKNYGFDACQAQSWSIRHACKRIHKQTEKKSVHDCKIGKLVSKSKKLHFKNILPPKVLEELINDPAVLSRVLDASVSASKDGEYLLSHKEIWTPLKTVNVNNIINIKKIDDYTYKIIGENYDNIFVYNTVTIKLTNDEELGNSNINIISNTFLKQSALDKVRFIPSVLTTLMNKSMNGAFNRLKEVVKENIPAKEDIK